MRLIVAANAFIAAIGPSASFAQSAHLAALENSAPRAVAEPIIGGFGVGLAGVFQDPSSAGRATGVLFSIFRSTDASVELYHAVAAFKAGPRWSFHYAATELRDLFDTSLTNIDPTLSALRARAMLVGLDGTLTAWNAITVSAGFSSAHDENVGEHRSATIGRLHARVFPGAGVSAGIHWTKAAGELGESVGRLQADLGVRRRLRGLDAGLLIAVQKGAVWRYSEVHRGIAAGGFVELDSIISLNVGIARYATTFGVNPHEWRAAASIGVNLGAVRMAASYTDTRLGLGSGYGLSFGYQPHD